VGFVVLNLLNVNGQEQFVDTKGVIRIVNQQTMQWSKGKRTEGQATIYKTQHRKLKD
jgi:hypothetical protein